MTRVLVTGSRSWPSPGKVWQALDAVVAEHGEAGLVVIHGACPTGADADADQWCARRGITVERHPADWRRLGGAAGPVRNEEMVATRPDLTLAFLMPDSRGTADCVRRVVRDGLPVRRFYWVAGQ